MSSDPATQPLALRCRGISHRYLDRYPSLDRVSFDIAPGDRVALIGANGCGKSTLLKIIDGLVFPTEGHLEVFGVPITERALGDAATNASFRARVGFVFQNSDVQLFSATVRDEIAFGPLHLGLSGAEVAARIDDTLALLSVEHLADRPPFMLSGGEAKRVAIATVLVMGPDLWLFDEPTSALDPRSRDQVIELIAALGDAGKTIVTATHDLEALPALAARAIVLDESHRVAADGPVAAILRDRDLLGRVNLISTSR